MKKPNGSLRNFEVNERKKTQTFVSKDGWTPADKLKFLDITMEYGKDLVKLKAAFDN